MEAQQTMSFETTSSGDRKNSSRLVFEQLINQAIDEILSSLGIACKSTVYDCLEKQYELNKNDVADHTAEFCEALEGIFGEAAALIEIQIMKELSRKVPQFKHWSEGMLTFPDYVDALSHFICR